MYFGGYESGLEMYNVFSTGQVISVINSFDNSQLIGYVDIFL
jgi:hypothetical protein